MDPVAPSSPPSLALKIATLLFSGGLATLAIANGGSLGCSPAETPDQPPAPDTIPPPPSPPPRALETPAEPIAPESARVNSAPVNAPPAPDANASADANVNAPPSPPRYLGGSKSDVDVWGVEGEGVGGLGLVGAGRGDEGGELYIGGSKSGLLHRRPATSTPQAQRAERPRKNKPTNTNNSNRQRDATP